MGLTCWSRRHHCRLACGHLMLCLLLVIALVCHHPSLARATLLDGKPKHDDLGGRFDQDSLANAEVVGDLEIFTRVEVAAGQPHPDPADTSLPHGREVRVGSSSALVGVH